MHIGLGADADRSLLQHRVDELLEHRRSTSDFDTLEMRAIATDSRFISSWVMCFMTSAAASSPIDSMTTADFSTSLSRRRTYLTLLLSPAIHPLIT